MHTLTDTERERERKWCQNKIIDNSICYRLKITLSSCWQTLRFTKEMGRFTGLRAAVVLGGDSLEGQFAAMHDNPDIIIATPGRYTSSTQSCRLPYLYILINSLIFCFSCSSLVFCYREQNLEEFLAPPIYPSYDMQGIQGQYCQHLPLWCSRVVYEIILCHPEKVCMTYMCFNV